MSFSSVIAQFSKGTKDKVDRIRKGVTIKLFNAVVLDTPVDTGRLRGNWKLSEGSPDTSSDENTDKSGQLTLGLIQEGVQKTDGDTTLYLSNNLPYAHRIEFDGWSHTKAPAGMARKNIARFNQLIRIESANKQ